MAEFMILMKGDSESDGWPDYIESLIASGRFRGGSALGNGVCVRRAHADERCDVTGFMRFEADSIEEVLRLVEANPSYVAGDPVEVLEIVES